MNPPFPYLSYYALIKAALSLGNRMNYRMKRERRSIEKEVCQHPD